MLMPTSSEFVALCRSQISLLSQTLGASLSVVYLTEELVEGAETTLIAIAAYPESSSSLEKSSHLALPSADTPQLPTKNASVALPDAVTQAALSPANALTEQRQFVLPLVHEGLVLGLLVTERDDRPWTNWERSQIEKIADTLALACVMDQRAQWLDHTRRQQRLSQTQQHDVLDNLLHQFRNPLTALRTFGKLLLRRLQPEDANREVATSIVRESDRLQELLVQFDQAIDLGEVDLISPNEADFTDPSKSAIPLLPAGVLTASSLTLEPCAIAQILQPLLVSARAMAQDKKLTIRTAIPESLPLVVANSGALREVLSNLIDNALKYTPAGEQVHIRVDGGDRVAIRVSDTGCGIPPQDLPRLFERHYRGVQAQTDIQGTGLGLAIAYRLVEQMQGEIEAFSPMKPDGWISENSDQPPANKGTTFVVWLRRSEH